MNFSAERLQNYFDENFSDRSELGASVSIWQGEQEVLSLSGGRVTRQDDAADWQPDTLVPVWSATKGPAGFTVLLALNDAGISPHDPVEKVWPELKAAGNGGLSFAQLLGHRSGLAALNPDNRPSILHHGEVVKALQKQEPFWQAGLDHGYHPRTSGALMDELVRRLTGGITLGQYWFQKVAEPLGIDLFIGGLGTAELDRLATIYPPKSLKPPKSEAAFYQALADPESLSLWAFASPGGMKGMSDINKLEYLQSAVPSLGGVGSARGLAKFYAMLANRGSWEGVQIFPQSLVDSLSYPVSNGEDQTLLIPTAFSAGFMLDPFDPDSQQKLRQNFGPSLRAFGQPGAGGSHAFADPENGLSFAYVMNQMESGILPNEKSLGLVNLLYS